MRLFHFTTEDDWPEIAAAGEIVSPAELERRNPERISDWFFKLVALQDVLIEQAVEAGPDAHAGLFAWFEEFPKLHDGLVWLTTHWLPPRWRPKNIRIEVQIDDAHRWRPYARERGIPHQASDVLADTGPGRFYVSERSIPKTEWIAVDRLPSDWVAASQLPAGSPVPVQDPSAVGVLWRQGAAERTA